MCNGGTSRPDIERWLGRWVGAGTVLPQGAQYEEELVLSTVLTPKGRCFQFYAESWKAGSQHLNPMHMEIGLLRQIPDTTHVELLLSHPFGLLEMSTGELQDGHIRLEATALTSTATAKPPFVTGLRRHYWMENDNTLRYELWMQIEGREMEQHLEAVLIFQP